MGQRVQNFAVDFRSGTRRTDMGRGYVWEYGSFAAPDWVYTIVAIIAIILLAAGFGAIYSGLGAIVTIITTLAFMNWGILTDIGAGIGFFGGLAVVTVLYFLRERDQSIGMMAYKAATFLIFFNFAIMIINGSGIISDTTIDIYGNNCQGDNRNTPGCILARIATLAPAETTDDSSSMWQQISFVLVTATAFGLIILTLQYMLGLFWFGYGISATYLNQLPLSWEWLLVLNAGCLIIYVTGFMQYKGQTSLRDKE